MIFIQRKYILSFGKNWAHNTFLDIFIGEGIVGILITFILHYTISYINLISYYFKPILSNITFRPILSFNSLIPKHFLPKSLNDEPHRYNTYLSSIINLS